MDLHCTFAQKNIYFLLSGHYNILRNGNTYQVNMSFSIVMMFRQRTLIPIAAAVLVTGWGQIAHADDKALTMPERGEAVLNNLTSFACEEAHRLPAAHMSDLPNGLYLSRQTLKAACFDAKSTTITPERPPMPETSDFGDPGDGELLAAQRMLNAQGVHVDFVAYQSSGLAVGGILCYPEGGLPRAAVLHLHGGLGGAIHNAEGNILETCINWALLHDRVAFAPSYRGQDGGEGSVELCKGEADDVAAAALMVRNLPIVDPTRVGIVGGSIGGCVALRAAALIPNLKAVVAYVPPADWKTLVEYHRTSWEPGIESLCDGSTIDWNIGGPELADVLDNVICGHLHCSDEEYDARSTIPSVYVQTAPTLIVAAEDDNVVPFEQQILYSLFREQLGNPVDIYVVDPCEAPASPPYAFDSQIIVLDSFHALSPAPISSGLLFLMNALDQ